MGGWVGGGAGVSVRPLLFNMLCCPGRISIRLFDDKLLFIIYKSPTDSSIVLYRPRGEILN